MSFDMPADAYADFMGRFSTPLADRFLALVDVETGQRVVDVGCGPGVLTRLLVERVGAEHVAAIDPSPPFVAATRATFPAADVRSGAAEHLPWPDASFDHAFAQLVVHFMADPVAGLSEMRRVVRPGGRVAASVWDHAGDRSPLRTFWAAVHQTDPGADDQATTAGSRPGHLAELLDAAGLVHVESGELSVEIGFESFEQWWAPYERGAGPVGVYVAGVDAERRRDLSERCRALLPSAPFTVSATAWYAVGARDRA